MWALLFIVSFLFVVSFLGLFDVVAGGVVAVSGGLGEFVDGVVVGGFE